MKLFKYSLLSGILIHLFIVTAQPVFAWTNGQDAYRVLGQPDFTTNNNFDNPATSLNAPNGIAYDPVTQRLFVCDMGRERILIYNLDNGIVNAMAGSLVLGQANLNGTASLPLSPSSLQSSLGIAFDSVHGRIFVADESRHRVMIFNVAPGAVTNNISATYFLGQTAGNVSMPGSPPTANNLYGPAGIAYDSINKRLFVADRGNHRVLVFNVPVGVNLTNINATYILGQSGTAGLSASHFNKPSGVAYDPADSRLFVGDTRNNRVLVFDVPFGPNLTGNNATYVLGQPTLTSDISAVTQATLIKPAGVSFDANTKKLYVADLNNNRVMIFHVPPGSDLTGTAATWVLGQPDFTSNTPGTTINRLYHPADLSIDPTTQRLFVTDLSNHRVLVFSPFGPGCGTLAICGKVMAIENPAIVLPGVPLELRDHAGRLLKTRKSATDGTYSFTASDGLVVDKTYSVDAMVGRTQSVVPLRAPINSITPQGEQADFRIRGWPGTFAFSNLTPGTFVQISTFSYTGQQSIRPLTLQPGGKSSGNIFTAVAGKDGKATIPVPARSTYFLTCWRAQPDGNSTQFTRAPVTGSQSLNPIEPNQKVSAVCP